MADNSLRLAEVEDAALATGPQDARDLAPAGIVVGKVAEAKGRGDEAEVLVGKRETQGVRFDPVWCCRLAVCRDSAETFRPRALQHGVGGISTPNTRRGGPCLFAQGKGHIASTTAEIQNPGVGLAEDLCERACGAAPPQAIHVKRQHVIKQVYAGSDRREHLSDGARR